MKTIEQYFHDWESDVFGFGYGSGEEHVIPALRSFLAAIDPPESVYDAERLERAVTPPVAWLLINVLCGEDILSYGTSPRRAWLTPPGRALREFMLQRTIEQLLAALEFDEKYVPCFPDHCNCAAGDCKVENPFWRSDHVAK